MISAVPLGSIALGLVKYAAKKAAWRLVKLPGRYILAPLWRRVITRP